MRDSLGGSMRRSVKIGLAILLTAAAVLLHGFVAERISLYRLEHADPTVDADRAIQRGDLRLVSVEMVVITVPGADSIMGRSEVYGCSLRRIGPYASDLIADDLQGRYNAAALNYARIYNLRVLERARHCQKAAA